jgi:hypothetical protein
MGSALPKLPVKNTTALPAGHGALDISVAPRPSNVPVSTQR